MWWEGMPLLFCGVYLSLKLWVNMMIARAPTVFSLDNPITSPEEMTTNSQMPLSTSLLLARVAWFAFIALPTST